MEKRKITKKEIYTFALYQPLMFFGVMPPMIFINAFLTEQLLLSAAFVATFLLVARFVDIAIGLSAGGIITRSNMKWGKYRSFFIICRWTFLIGLLLQFTYTVALPVAVRAVIVVIGYITMHGSMNFIAPSQFGMIGVMAGPDLDVRNKLTFAGVRFGSVGNIIYSLTFVPFLTLLSNSSVGPGWAHTIAIGLAGVIMVLGMSIAIKVSKPYDVQKVAVEGAPAPPKVTVGDMAKSVVQNKQLLILFVSQAFAMIGGQVLQALMLYYYLFILGNIMYMTLAMTVSTMFGLVGAIVGPIVGVRLGKKWAMVIGMGLSAVGMGLIAFFADMGVWYYIGFSCFNALAMAFYTGFGQQYYLDAGEYGYYQSGKDNRPVALAIGNMPIKLGFLLGGSIGMYALALIGYTPGMVPTPEFASAFMMILGGIPAVLYAIGAVIMAIGYKINEADVVKYTEENTRRDAELLANESAQ